MRQQPGSAPKQIRRNLQRAFDRLDQDITELEQRSSTPIALREAILPAVRIYAQIIAVHPWEDGNGRTAWLVLNHTLIRSGLLAVATEPTDESRVALGRAITRRGRRDPGPLADLLADAIKRSHTHADTSGR